MRKAGSSFGPVVVDLREKLSAALFLPVAHGATGGVMNEQEEMDETEEMQTTEKEEKEEKEEKTPTEQNPNTAGALVALPSELLELVHELGCLDRAGGVQIDLRHDLCRESRLMFRLLLRPAMPQRKAGFLARKQCLSSFDNTAVCCRPMFAAAATTC